MSHHQKIALITGISGMDGSTLAELLLHQGYIVHGIIRRSSQRNTQRLDNIYKDQHDDENRLFLHYGDLCDSSSLDKIVRDSNPVEVYHLAAQSHVKISFDMPEYSCDVDAIGTLRLLEAVRKHNPKIRVYMACTSEMFGEVIGKEKQNEETPFHPRSPYGCAKVFSYYLCKNYIESYGMFISCGILFNHTGPKRGENFVEQKIVKAAVAISKGKQPCLYLGNIYSIREIGSSIDYCDGMRLMLQQEECDVFVLATGEKHTIKEIVNIAFEKVGIHLEWSGLGVEEIATNKMNDQIIVRIDPKYFRPAEVEYLWGDSTKAQKKLGWKPKYTFDDIITEMIEEEMKKY